MSSKRITIIVAGGVGTRMKSEIPKQFLLLLGKPVLMRTIHVFRSISSISEIILVLPMSQKKYWNDLCEKFHFRDKYTIVDGGNTRFQSVKNGLKKVSDLNALVAIHDGVRPMVSKEIIESCFQEAEKYGSAVPAIMPTETVRLGTFKKRKTSLISRKNILLIQTPQVFRASILKKCYKISGRRSFTDDSSVVEFSGEKIHVIEGDQENIKITTQQDLNIVSVLFQMKTRL